MDIPKLYDLAAIYGPLNTENVRKLISNVFESDNRYLTDISQSIDTMITLLKKSFNAALKVTEMTNGDLVLSRTQ